MYENRSGRCLGGYHPWLAGEQHKSEGAYTFLNTLYVNQIIEDSLSVPTCSKFLIKNEEDAEEACTNLRKEGVLTFKTSSKNKAKKCYIAEMTDAGIDELVKKTE